MEHRLRKEFRALLPPWLLALLLATTPLWWRPTTDERAASTFWVACFGLGMVLLAVAAFGKEFSHGTLLALLCQPISRRRLWLEKALALAVAMGSVLLLFGVVHTSGTGHPMSDFFANPAIGTPFLLSFAAFSGGLCLSLLLRQPLSAFWFALLLPIALSLTLQYVRAKWFPAHSASTWWRMSLILYSVASCSGSVWLFLRYQDTYPLRDLLLHPLHLRVSRVRRRKSRDAKPGSGIASLFWKELHLHQLNFLCAVLFLLLLIGGVVARESWETLAAQRIAGTLHAIAWLFLGLILLLAGAVTISEERRLGLLDGQLSLPLSRRRQFLIKLLVAYLVCMVIALVAWLLHGLGWWFFGRGVFGVGDFHAGLLGWLAAFAVIMTTLGLYASSLSRSLLQSLTVAGVLVIAIAVATALLEMRYGRFIPSPLVLGRWLALPILSVLLLVLTFRNWTRAVIGFRGFLRDASILGIAIASIFLTTTVLYARV